MIIKRKDYICLIKKIYETLTGQKYPSNANVVWKQQDYYVAVNFYHNNEGILLCNCLPKSFEYRDILDYLKKQKKFDVTCDKVNLLL